MRPLKLEGGIMFAKPKDWDEERDGICHPLSVVYKDGRCLSVWEPSFEERLRIVAGHNIALTIVGGQPPVLLTVADVKDEHSPKTEVEILEPKKSLWQRFCEAAPRWVVFR